MVRTYKRKSTREGVDPERVNRALELVRKDKFSIRKAARCVGINNETLRLYVHGKRSLPTDIQKSPFNHRQVFSSPQEAKIAEYLKTCSALFHGLRQDQARELAFEFGQKNDIRMPDSWHTNKKAGVDWLQGFIKRNGLSLRTPEATSMVRAQGFNKQAVDVFFKNLKDVLTRFKFKPVNIYNLDETGITNVHAFPRVISEKGRKQVGQITSQERGTLVTVCCTVNAIGNALPPFFVFPRVNYRSVFLNGAPPGSEGTATPKGWMTAQTFKEMLEHFKRNVKPSSDDPVLLLIDNHESHINIGVFEFARENGIVIVTFPPHCSHRLQPLDVTVYGPLKTAYKTSLNDWNVSHPGKRPSIYDLPEIFSKAFTRSMTPQNIVKGFKITGIYPFDSEIFPESDFAPSLVFNPVLEQSESPEPPETNVAVDEDVNQEFDVSDVRPFPQLKIQQDPPAHRKKGKSRILTDSPEKDGLIQKSINMKKKTFRCPKDSKKAHKEREEEDFMEILRSRVSQGQTSGTSGLQLLPTSSVDLDDDNQNMSEIVHEDKENNAVIFSSLRVHDFIVVKVQSAKRNATSKNFVAQIMKVDESATGLFYSVKFLKISKRSDVLRYSDEDICLITPDEIVAFLEPPVQGKTKRTEDCFQFVDCDLSMFGVFV